MNILFLWPPHIPSYFNAGHHLPLFQTAQYVRKNTKIDNVKCIDAGVLNYTWKEIADILSQNKFDFIAVMNDFDAIDTFPRTIRYIKKLSSDSKIITFGRLSKSIPKFFEKYDIDAIVYSGDYETSVVEFINYSLNYINKPKGIFYKDNNKWCIGEKGEFLDSSKWEFPDFTEFPFEAYDSMYKNDRNKFCGIPNRRELVVNVSRGCTVGCKFCDVPKMQGLLDRRIDYRTLVEYIKESFKLYPFEYVTFYSPTFTLDRQWTINFCKLMKKTNKKYPWKCVTTIEHLDKELILKMKEAGCVRISIGVETIDELAEKELPLIKRKTKQKIKLLLEICNQIEIELNCFVILGLPGETISGAKETIKFLKKYNARVRPTIYTPYNLLSSNMNIDEIATFNRQLFIDKLINEEIEREFYNIFYEKENKLTEVYKKIEKRR